MMVTNVATLALVVHAVAVPGVGVTLLMLAAVDLALWLAFVAVEALGWLCHLRLCGLLRKMTDRERGEFAALWAGFAPADRRDLLLFLTASWGLADRLKGRSDVAQAVQLALLAIARP